MDKSQLSSLPRGTILHHKQSTNSDGTPLRARINGKMQEWKTRPHAWQMPVKYGLRTCFYINETNIDEWEIAED